MIRSGCVTLEVGDLERGLEFWGRDLGLEQRFRIGDWAELRAACGFRLALRRFEAPRAGAGMEVGFGADRPLEAVRERLLTLGVAVGEVVEDREAAVRLLPFRDPEGRSHYFWEASRPGGAQA